MSKLKLYVWPAYARDYTSGLAFAIAEDSDKARDMIAEDAGYRSDSLAQRPEVYDLNSPVVYQQSGGG